MITYSALTTVSGEAAAQALGEDLENLEPAPTGVGVFEIEDGSGLWEVGGYFLNAPDGVALALLAAVHGAKDFVISEVPDRDWVAHVRRELSPVTAGRFFVYGSHDAGRVPEDCVALLIEASMAFGTGHHGTTLGCLLAFEDLLQEGATPVNVIDVGCGTAVLAMAAASVTGHVAIASDIDPIAVEVAKANAAANNLGDVVNCLEAVGFDHAEIYAKAPFDLIFANILKGPLLSLGAEMAQQCAPNGTIILSGILLEQGDDVIAAYQNHGFKLSQRRDIGEWTALRMTKTPD